MYRLNYGNGQVNGNFSTYAKVKEAYVAQVRFDRDAKQSSAYLRIERYEGDGEWSTLGIGKAKSRPHVD